MLFLKGNIMRPMYDNKCMVTCTDNDKVAEAEVDHLIDKDRLTIFLAQNKIHMKYNGSVYVGNQFGYEFTTKGPVELTKMKGRGDA